MKRIVFCLLSLVLLLTACAAPVPSSTPILPTGTAVSPPTGTSLPTSTSSSTEPPAPTLTPLPLSMKFAVIGDFGLDDVPEADVSALVHGWQPDIIITVGDNNYPSGAADTIDANIGKYYHDYIFPYSGAYGSGADRNRFFPSLGNHDWRTAGAQPYLDYFTLPGNERYYDFSEGPVHFFALDSDGHEPDGVNAGSEQAAWLQQGLAASTSPWNVVYMHHPPFSSGLHGSIDWMQWPFAAWGADALFAGHDHLYERLNVDGIPYFTDGTGGGSLYNFILPLPQSQFRYNANYGAMLVTASDTEMLFEFYNRVGELIDSYQVIKP
jgi:tartrate-resistant acid phosphatase type 5